MIDNNKTITAKINTLKNWFKSFDHTHIYIYIYLKIDIESSEYDFVVKLFMQDWLPFTQFLIENHDRLLKKK